MIRNEKFRRLWGVVCRAWQRHRSRRELLQMNDCMLKDIGISRADALWEASKPFWRE